jgi:hypothetical protein
LGEVYHDGGGGGRYMYKYEAENERDKRGASKQYIKVDSLNAASSSTSNERLARERREN